MNEFINYLSFCIKPNNITELYINNVFNDNIFRNLIQDGIMITNDKPSDTIINENQIEYVLINNIYISKKIYRNLHWLNDDNTITFTKNQDPIYRRLTPPPHETVNHTLIIKLIISYMNNSEKKGTFIEYGVRSGHNFNTISNLNNKGKNIGVDMKILDHLYTEFKNNTTIQLHQMMTDMFSENILPDLQPDIVFIDADHNSSSVIKDFENTFKYLKVGGYIILHDTYPCMPELLDPMGCSDCYKTPLYIKNKYIKNKNNKAVLSILTLPLNPGVSIIRKLIQIE